MIPMCILMWLFLNSFDPSENNLTVIPMCILMWLLINLIPQIHAMTLSAAEAISVVTRTVKVFPSAHVRNAETTLTKVSLEWKSDRDREIAIEVN